MPVRWEPDPLLTHPLVQNLLIHPMPSQDFCLHQCKLHGMQICSMPRLYTMQQTKELEKVCGGATYRTKEEAGDLEMNSRGRRMLFGLGCMLVILLILHLYASSPPFPSVTGCSEGVIYNSLPPATPYPSYFCGAIFVRNFIIFQVFLQCQIIWRDMVNEWNKGFNTQLHYAFTCKS